MVRWSGCCGKLEERDHNAKGGRTLLCWRGLATCMHINLRLPITDRRNSGVDVSRIAYRRVRILYCLSPSPVRSPRSLAACHEPTDPTPRKYPISVSMRMQPLRPTCWPWRHGTMAISTGRRGFRVVIDYCPPKILQGTRHPPFEVHRFLDMPRQESRQGKSPLFPEQMIQFSDNQPSLPGSCPSHPYRRRVKPLQEFQARRTPCPIFHP